MSFSMKVPPKWEGDFELPPAGIHPAYLIGFVDLGTTPREFKGKTEDVQKVLFLWELTGEKDSKGQNFVAAADYTASLHEKANLRKMLEGWRGSAFADGTDIDFHSLVGKACMVNLSEGLSANQKKFIEVASVSRPLKNLNIPDPTMGPFLWDFNIHAQSGASEPQIPEWVPMLYGRKVADDIKRSKEWELWVRSKLIPAVGDPQPKDNGPVTNPSKVEPVAAAVTDDDIPF